MIKNGLGLYLTDTIIYLCTKDKIYKEPVDKEILIHNRVALTNEFYHFMNKIIKKNKLNDTILGKNLTIIDLPNYLESDKELLNSIFEKLSFNNIKYIKYVNLMDLDLVFNLNEANAYIILNKKNYFIDYNNLFDSIENYLLNLIKKIKSSEIFFLGNYHNLKKVVNSLEKRGSFKIYTFQNNEDYVINKLKEFLF